jgi:hypothetical protein
VPAMELLRSGAALRTPNCAPPPGRQHASSNRPAR